MILVTGPTGFVGRRVVGQLHALGIPTRALVRSTSRTAALPREGIELAQGDVLDAESLAKACVGADAVIHLAAVIRQKGKLSFQSVNYGGARNLLAAAKAAGVKRFIYASTIGATSDASIPYLYSRWMAEQEIARSGVPYTIVRFSVGFGEGDEFFNVLAALVKLMPVVPIVGDGQSKFQPIAVDDAARCLVEAYRQEGHEGKTYDIGGPERYTYAELVDVIARTLGAKYAKVRVPVAAMKPAAAVMEALTPSPPVTPEQLKMLHLDSIAEPDSVQKAFGFTPRPIQGNIDYLRKIGIIDALSINLGFMPAHIRDH
ncbi:MAG: complex I NDUFA9 subunit family protein [SAR202 cluster bacterium]|nr:complex I NDUFA9 subunit family protein [SAR202 cluster bacterium]